MRRRTVHAGFAALLLVCAAAALVQGLRLQRLTRLNQALAAIAAAPPASAPAAAASGEPRSLQLARATALARAGADDAAFKIYSTLIAAGPQDTEARQALFNLGNLYLRQGLGGPLPAQGDAAAPAAADRAPLVELAKQRYRDLLRAAPDDWDARYNLERALRLAPEEHAAAAEEENVPVERRRVMLRGMEPGDLP